MYKACKTTTLVEIRYLKYKNINKFDNSFKTFSKQLFINIQVIDLYLGYIDLNGCIPTLIFK